jgi:uncharacterized membrane-anchored protein YitT (DUF2179 family)
MLDMFIEVMPYIVLGASIRIVWGMYRAFNSFLSLHLSWRRLLAEFMVSVLFGMFGGVALSQLGIFSLGISLGSMVSSLLGANVVDLIAKKFGFSKKMEVIVSDEQLGFTEFNQRQINAMTYVRAQGKITNKIYQRINNTTRDVARHELDSLVSKGKLKRIGKSKGAYYVST